jgi:RHS repeat-associated protein
VRTPFCVSAENFAISAVNQDSRGDDNRIGLSGRERVDEREGRRGTLEESKAGRRGSDVSSAVRRTEAPRVERRSVRSTASGGTKSSQLLSGVPAGGAFYIYSFDGRLLAEYNILGGCVRDYVYFGGQLIAEYQTTGEDLYYYTSDQINSTRIVTNSSGTVVYSAAHNPYGGIQKTWVNSYDPSLKFSGKERDAESGLDYFGARYYDRAQYRFMSVDPLIPALAALGDPQQWNLYGYCRSNPINYIDPDGEQTIEIMRYHYGTDATYGIYGIELGDKTIYGYTLEPAKGVGKGPIPEGEYDAIPYWWSNKGYQVYWLQDVPGFTEILMHRGNVPADTDGCQLVGKTLSGGGIGGSKMALDEIMFEIRDFTADLIQGEIANGLNDLELLSHLCSGQIRVRIWAIRLPEGVVTYTVVVQ